MSSSGGSDDMGGLLGLLAMRGAATPMPNLPVAGKDSATGDPAGYGRFQSFLPNIQASGPNPSATGLRPEMFQYRSPSGVADPEVQGLRDQLATLQASSAQPAAAPVGNPQWAALRASMSPQDLAIFQRSVSPAEFQAFMSAGMPSSPATAGAPATGGAPAAAGVPATGWSPSLSMIGPPGDPAVAAQIAQAMARQGGPQATQFGGAGFDFNSPGYLARLKKQDYETTSATQPVDPARIG